VKNVVTTYGKGVIDSLLDYLYELYPDTSKSEITFCSPCFSLLSVAGDI
jgi:hypothetical protein